MTQQEVLLQHLIEIYRGQGVPLDSLMKSPFFQSLPIEKKLDIIRAVGQSARNKMGFTKDDTKKLLLGLGLGVLGGGLAALTMHNFSTNYRLAKATGEKMFLAKIPLPLVAVSASTSILGAAGSNLSDVYRNHQDRQALRNMDLSNDNSILQHIIHREN